MPLLVMVKMHEYRKKLMMGLAFRVSRIMVSVSISVVRVIAL